MQTSSSERLALKFGAVDTMADPLVPRHNVAPSTAIPAVIMTDGRRLGLLRWGFVPPWAKTLDDGPRPINARSEGAATSRLFGPALARRRCIVPVDAWYEWAEEDGARQPWLLTAESGGPVAVAALWSIWRDRSSDPATTLPVSTVALITTAATGAAAQVHHRMPLIVPEHMLKDWLDPLRTQAQDLLEELSLQDLEVRIARVSRRVNDVRNDDASLLEPVEL